MGRPHTNKEEGAPLPLVSHARRREGRHKMLRGVSASRSPAAACMAATGPNTIFRTTHTTTNMSCVTSTKVARGVNHLAFRASQAVRGDENIQTACVGAEGEFGNSKQETSCRVKLRFKRMGRKKRPFYRLVAIDSRRKREGLALEELGWYNPLTKETYINAESVQKWLSDGAEPSDTVASLLKKTMPTFEGK